MITLYHQPGACSLASHILLEDSGLAYQTHYIDIHAGQSRSAAYLAINPKGRIPALVHGDAVITESPAILNYIAGLVPKAGYLPSSLLGQTRVLEWMNWLSGSLHAVAFATLIHPDWFASADSAQDEVRVRGEQAVIEHFTAIDRHLAGREWAVEDSFSLVDPYLFVFYTWGRLFKMPMQTYGYYHAHALRMNARPAVSRVMVDEEIPAIE